MSPTAVANCQNVFKCTFHWRNALWVEHFFFRVDASGKERATTNCDARRSRSTNFARPNRIVYLHIGDLVSAVWHDVCTRAASECLLYRIAVARATLQKCQPNKKCFIQWMQPKKCGAIYLFAHINTYLHIYDVYYATHKSTCRYNVVVAMRPRPTRCRCITVRDSRNAVTPWPTNRPLAICDYASRRLT